MPIEAPSGTLDIENAKLRVSEFSATTGVGITNSTSTRQLESIYPIRYIDADGTQTDEANAVHIAAFVGCTYHCG